MSTGQYSSETSPERLPFTMDRDKVQLLTIGQSEEINDYGVLSPQKNIYLPPTRSETTVREEVGSLSEPNIVENGRETVFSRHDYCTHTLTIAANTCPRSSQ